MNRCFSFYLSSPLLPMPHEFCLQYNYRLVFHLFQFCKIKILGDIKIWMIVPILVQIILKKEVDDSNAWSRIELLKIFLMNK